MADKTLDQLNSPVFKQMMSEGFTALMQFKQGFDFTKIADANTRLYDAEAQMEEGRARYNEYIIRMRADIEQEQLSREGQRLMGAKTANWGGSGVSLASGSVLNDLALTAGEIARDMEQIQFNADTEVDMSNYESASRATGLRNRAASEKFSARIARNNKFMEGASTLVKAKVDYDRKKYGPMDLNTVERKNPGISPAKELSVTDTYSPGSATKSFLNSVGTSKYANAIQRDKR